MAEKTTRQSEMNDHRPFYSDLAGVMLIVTVVIIVVALIVSLFSK